MSEVQNKPKEPHPPCRNPLRDEDNEGMSKLTYHIYSYEIKAR